MRNYIACAYKDVYLGSRDLSDWLRKEGLVYNKVLAQVAAPKWIYSKRRYMQRFLKGFFDTDGSVYKLRFGVQVAFNNNSKPLLEDTHKMLRLLQYRVSKVSGFKIYLTFREDVVRFFQEIRPANPKHQERLGSFVGSNQEIGAGTQAANGDAL